MEKLTNIGGQNTQQIGQNPINQPVQVPEKSKINYLVMTGVILVCFVVFGFGGYSLGRQSKNISEKIPTDSTTLSISPAPQTSISPLNPSAPPTSLKIDTSNWITSGSRADGFTLKHPKNVTYGETVDNYARFIMFDESNPDKYKIKEIQGLEFRVKRVSYSTDKTLEQVVAEDVENSKESGDILENTKPVTVGSYSGFTYKSQGLGIHRYYFLAIDPKDYTFPNKRDYFYIINSSTDQYNLLFETILATLQNSRI